MYERVGDPGGPGRRSSIKPTRAHRDTFASEAPQARIVGVDIGHLPLWNPVTHLPEAEDVDQGEVGDCWVLATLAALAHLAPAYLKSLVEVQDNGRFLVHLDKDIDVGPVIDAREVDGEAQAQPLYAHFRRAAWVPVMEKAFARRDVAGRLEEAVDEGESYQLIHVGTPVQATQVFCEGATRRVPVADSYDPMADLADIGRSLAENRLLVANISKEGVCHSVALVARTATGFRFYDPHGRFFELTEAEFLSQVLVVYVSGLLKPRAGVPLTDPVHRTVPRDESEFGVPQTLPAAAPKPQFALPQKPKGPARRPRTAVPREP